MKANRTRHLLLRFALALGASMLLTLGAVAQDPTSLGVSEPSLHAAPPPFPSPDEIVSQSIGYGAVTSYEFLLSILVTILGAVIVGAQTFLFLRMGGVDANDVLRSYAVILVLMGALFAVTAGFDDKQIAPTLGLFGTVVGYLLGRNYKPEFASPASTSRRARNKGE